MKMGTFYGLGVGPGDPELLTLKAASVLGQCKHVFAPKSRIAGDSVALEIAQRYLSPGGQVHELVFPMTSDKSVLAKHWAAAAAQIVPVLQSGEDACFITLGDPLVYSTYIYLLRELRALMPDASVVTVPGITSFCAAASLTDFTIGEGKENITVVPTADDLEPVRQALAEGGTVVLMKIGNRLQDILKLLDAAALLEQSVFVARAGQAGQRVETDLRKLKDAEVEAGYLSIILVHAQRRSN